MNAMTEQEAKGKLCPMSHTAQNGFERCIASACMAWRWKDTAYKGDPFHGMGADGWADNPIAADAARKAERDTQQRTLGYCGLANKGA